ncbi:MAG: site-2 protease family protein [Tepidisphaerales bacterium]
MTPPLPASIPFDSPVFWALVIAWIFTVALHEFGHGLAAYLGGDYTIRERGGLTLNPLQYVDPLMSIVLPILFLALGGVPLPGGVTYVRTDLLRSRAWETLVSLAGPAMNLLVLLALVALMHPALGLFDLTQPVSRWSNLQLVMASLAALQAVTLILNLLPVPPLDGFGAVAPYLPADFVQKVRTPPLNFLILAGLFLLVFQLPVLWNAAARLLLAVSGLVAGGPDAAVSAWQALRLVLG